MQTEQEAVQNMFTKLNIIYLVYEDIITTEHSIFTFDKQGRFLKHDSNNRSPVGTINIQQAGAGSQNRIFRNSTNDGGISEKAKRF